VYAVLGHPVHHSLSPPMQNAAFRATGRNAVYVAFDVVPDRLGEALHGLHAAGALGLNLTSPLKEAAWPFLCGATEEAERSRAVNTLRRESGGWLGHVTDGLGFVTWVLALGIPIRGARVLLLGAGGAARSIAPMLASLEPAMIGIVSRDGARSRSLVSWVGEGSARRTQIVSGSLDERPGRDRDGHWDLMIRALASGTVETHEAAWWTTLRSGAPVLELNYGTRARESRTRALSDGRRFEDGLGLLLYQGALSFEFWTGEPAPLDAMRSAVSAASV
jgi:shikimate dehydrogenase